VRTSTRRWATLMVAAAGGAALLNGTSQAEPPPPPRVTFRIATQAPEGTLWMDAMMEIKADIEERSRGNVRVLYYPNGSQGDERAVIERMQVGTLNGGLFTGIGLGEINPEVRILEAPFLYRNLEEVDAVKTALEERFVRGFDEAGYVFLGWAEVGWAYIFSTDRARNLDELRLRRIWVWQGDPLATRTFQTFGLNPVPLALTDVLTSLETEMIDSVYNSPYGLVGLQWHRDMNYMSRMTIGYGTGALLVAKSEWNKMPENIQRGIASIARTRLDALVGEIRERNVQTVGELEESGLEVLPLPEDELPLYRQLGSQVVDDMVGELWDQSLVDEVRAVLAERRGE
jgi:TRAP-type transport system periplasmic protein